MEADAETICDVAGNSQSELSTIAVEATSLAPNTDLNVECSVNSENSSANHECSNMNTEDTKVNKETKKGSSSNADLQSKEQMAKGTKKLSDKEDTIMRDDQKSDEIIMEELQAVAGTSTESSGVNTSQDTSPMSNENEPNISPTDQHKSKRSISKGQINGDSGISMEKSGNSSDEDSSKRQKLNESPSDNKREDGESTAYASSRFHKLKSKVKKRNYRNRKNLPNDTGENASEAVIDDSGGNTRPELNDSTLSRGSESHEGGAENNSDDQGQDGNEGEDDSSEWTTASEDELEEEEGTPACLKKEKPKAHWCVVPEVINREMGLNALFQRRFYGSLHAVERLELMYKLNEHQGCVNALNFNEKGNLLASGSDDLAVVIWDWAIGKKHSSFDSGHRSNMFQAKWLPFDVEYLMATCARDGQVRLLDLSRGTSRKLAVHHGSSHKLSVHPETPHVIISVGEDAKVLSIDIRESKPNKLLVVKDGTFEVQLYSVHSNPLNSNEFCVGGRSQSVRIYDRRKVSSPLYKLCPEHLSNNKLAHVTCAVYNYNGTEVLVSYNDEDIYLFDTMMPQCGDFAHRYQGHRNSATVKGVNFFGPKSEFILSGSDCGNIFIWEKNTEAIVQWMHGDEQGVVNCLEPHPHIPILATSGLDYDVKIWVPSCEQPPAMTNLESCVKSNARNRELENNSETNAFDGQMLWILLRHIRTTERRILTANRGSGDLNVGDDDDDADDSSNDNDSSDHSDSQSEGDGIGRLRCPPS